MSAIVNALDNFTRMQIGENGLKEYTWSNSFRERILQLSFQLNRTQDQTTITRLSHIYSDLIFTVSKKYELGLIIREEYIEYMSLLYRLIGQTRDIIDGKGEYLLSYMLLNAWSKYNLELAEYALQQFVINSADSNLHPYGSWKDIKNLYKYDKTSPLNKFALNLVLTQLNKDLETESPSLLAKWIPREKSSHSELFTILATNYFSKYIVTAKTEEAKKKAILKAKTEFRKIISDLNKKLDTVQIKQCANTWSTINPEKQTSLTMHKQKKAFLNLTKDGSERIDSEDRRLCANNFETYVERAVNGEFEIKGQRIGLNSFVEDVLYGSLTDVEKDIINLQWNNSSKSNDSLGKMIAMVDVSGSMHGDPMYAAIGLGLRIAEKSMLGNRILTFSAYPQWVNLDGIEKFTERVTMVRNSDWGMNTNFEAALNMILDAIILSKLDAKDVEDMVLVILSDMQMDCCAGNNATLYQLMESKYSNAGINVCGKPYKPPHILFWNLRSTSGFPTLSEQKNASMMSGFSPALLNLFCEEGISSLQSCTPWSLFKKSLDCERYDILDKKLRETI